MKKFTFGTPEKLVPSAFCENFTYTETETKIKESDFTFRKTPRGCVVEFEMPHDTHIFGMGLQLKQFDHSGKKLTMRVNADPQTPSGESHAPVPFFVTNKGYGMYFDTARAAEFYFGRKKRSTSTAESGFGIDPVKMVMYEIGYDDIPDILSVFIPADGIDIYVIEGDSAGDVVAQYNMLAGGGCDVPEWGLGVLYRCCAQYNDEKVKNMADYFRRADIPCDILGLEPGWQTHTYSCSYKWDEGRFPDPAGLVKYLRDRDFHVNLWEHIFVHPTSPIYNEIEPWCGEYEVWGGNVPDLSLPEARKIFAGHQKKVAVSLGVDGFKADECDSGDNTGGWSFPNHAQFPSGLDGEQYHGLIGVLYAQTLMQALDGKPTLSEIRNMGALAAPYPFVLYSDLYDHRDFVRGVATSSLSGLLWTPEVRHAHSKEELLRRLQSNVFSVQCLINAWYCDEVPWKDLDCENEVRELLKLRESLVPMLKNAFVRYRETGVPPVRALVMDFTDDPETYGIDDEYMFCENLLVAPIIAGKGNTRKVYLPAGDWVDFFSSEKTEAGWHEVTTENIPVFRKIR